MGVGPQIVMLIAEAFPQTQEEHVEVIQVGAEEARLGSLKTASSLAAQQEAPLQAAEHIVEVLVPQF